MSLTLLSSLKNKKIKKNEDQIFSLLFDEDELSWQTIIHDLVKSEEMDPWDIDVRQIAEKFIGLLQQMKELDFRISGKMVLAATYLLKIKTDRLLTQDILSLDNMINGNEVELFDELEELQAKRTREQGPKLVPRTPQPRQRKVSVFDLIEALEKTLVTEQKKQLRKASTAPKVGVPDKGKDMTLVISEVYKKIRKTLSGTRIIAFDQLLPSQSKEDKVYTFIPLLHLDTQRKLDIIQKEHLGEINIKLNNFQADMKN